MRYLLLFIILLSCSFLTQKRNLIWKVNQKISFHDKYLDVESVIIKPAEEKYHFCSDELTSKISSTVHNGEEILTFKHRVKIGGENDPIMYLTTPTGRILYTQLQPLNFCKLFPVPSDRLGSMSFNLQLDIPSKWSLIAFNLPKIISKLQDTTLWEIQSVAPIPFMSFAFVAGDMMNYQLPRSPEKFNFFSSVKYGEKRYSEIMSEFLEIQKLVLNYFNYKTDSFYNLVSIPGFGPGAMENFNMITVTEDLFSDVNKPRNWKKIRRFVLLHESVHQIIGNCLSPAHKADVFFVEGLTQYFSSLIAGNNKFFTNPFAGSLRDDLSVEVNDSNLESFFSKFSYELGSFLFQEISSKRGSAYLREEIVSFIDQEGCKEFDFRSLDPSLRRSVFNTQR